MNATIKTYSSASNAKRAALKAGIADSNIVIRPVDGGFTFSDSSAMEIPASLGGPNEPEALAAGLARVHPAGWAEIEAGGEKAPAGPATDPAGSTQLEPADFNEAPVVLRAQPVGKAPKAPKAGKGAKAGKPGLSGILEGAMNPKAKPAKAGKPAKAPKAAKPAKAPKAPKAPKEPKAPRETKREAFVAMLRRPEGCTLAQAMEAFGWQRHTCRGAIAGGIKVGLGLKVETEKVEGEMVYRIVD